MQNIIRRLFILLAFFIATKSYAQVFYYSGGKKITLIKDNTSFLINVDKSAAGQPFLNNLSKLDGIQALENTNDRNVIKVKLSANVNKGRILTALKENNKILHAWEAYDLNGTPFIPTGEILFKVKNGISEKEILNKLKLNAKLVVSSKKSFDISIFNVIDPATLFDISNLIYESNLVEWCHPNFFVPITTFTNDPLWGQQYYLRNTGQLGGVAGIDINIEGAWTLTRGANVRVAVIDDGVEDHEDLAGRVLNGFTPRNVNGNGRPINAGAHGEATAGIVAATQDNGIGISGVAPQSQIVPVNIFAGGETALDIANGINWAWNQGQADVLSNSWGYLTTSQTQPNFDAVIQAITNARTQGRAGRGSIVVFASGNSFGTGTGLDDVAFPGNVNGVVTVGACNNAAPAGAIWNYSERGASMDLVAPSGNINLNGDLSTLDRMGNAGYEVGNYTSRFGGTSAACPEVSGVAALMLSINPNLTEAQATNILRTTASDMGAAGFDNTFGYGRVNGCAATRQAFSLLSISGSNSFCSGTSQYSLPNIIPTASITWTSSNTSIATVSATGNPATVTQTGNGIVTITATINACGTNTIISKQIHVGTPGTNLLAIGGVTDNQTVCPNRPITLGIYYFNTSYRCGQAAGGITNAQWEVTTPSSSATISYNSGMAVCEATNNNAGVTITFPNLGYTYTAYVRAKAYNSCGWSNWFPSPMLRVQVNPNYTNCGGGGGGMLMISPNPSTSSTTIEALETFSFTQIKVYDKLGSVRKQFNFPKGTKKATINISELPADIYQIQAFDGKEWKTISFSKQ